MADVVVGGVRIAYRRRGSGSPLVLFHGAFEDSRIWADEFERLSPHVDVVAWDAPGCGASDDVPAGWDDADWSAAASGFITALGLRAPAVAGFSLGSMIALLLARDHPASVRRLVLVGAYAGWGGSLDSAALAQRIAAARFTLEHPVEECLLDVMTQDLRAGLSAIQTPTIVVRGTADARSPRSASLEMCELLPHARLVEIAGAGHDCTGPELDAVLIAAANAAASPPAG